MTLRHMNIFVMVCKCNSITGAAKKLYLAQPAVSLAISEIEEYYGIKLFDRISKKLYITDVGKQFLSYAIKITSQFEEMENEIKNWESVSSLKIGSSITIGTYLMPEIVKNFNSNYPEVSVNVLINNSRTIENKILENELDFALIEGLIHSKNILIKPFFNDKLVLICSNNHIFTQKSSVILDDLKNQKFLLREKESGTREIIDSIMASYGFYITPTWESTSTQAIIQAVINGIGISILPYQLVKREMHEEKIKIIPIEKINFDRQFNIIYHKDKYLTKSAYNFLELLKEENL